MPAIIFPRKNVLHILLALFVGLYMGINLSGIHPPNTVNDMAERLQADLQSAQAQVELWKSKANMLEHDYAAAINQVHKLEERHENCQEEEEDISNPANRHPHEDKLEKRQDTIHPHPVCQKLMPYPTPTALSLWMQHLPAILQATRLPNDVKYKFHDFTTQLLQLITPRLPRSIKSIPHDWASVERALSIAWERYHYLQLSPTERQKVKVPPRPLKVLVMGGSLLVGTNCRKLLTELNLQFRLPKRECTWSNRLGEFLNAYADSDIVQVTKVAMGGTNTATGNVIWQYDLIPEEAQHPDIVLNAYSTNDMHILTILEAQSSNVTLRDKVFDMTQEFVRNILHTCDTDRPPPLLLHVDDYLGNEQRTIWDTTELAQGVQVLANYYGFASFSYADVVREVVYGDTKEGWLSANWWETGKFEREIHPGMGMHIASTWVIAYNLLNLATTYCSLPPVPRDYNIHEYQAGYLGLPALHNDVAQAQYKPQSHPKGLPPVLTKDLLIEDVTRLWQESASKMEPCDAEKGGDAAPHHHVKCPFSWVSGLSLQQNNETWIQEYFRNHATVWDGWNLGNDGGKLGFTPTGGGGASRLRAATNSTYSMVLEFNFRQTIRSVTLFYMKSYGPRWKDSRLELSTWKKAGNDAAAALPTLLNAMSVVGVHDKETSEMYTEAMELREAIPVGTTLQVQAKLAGGAMFKIMGLAICS